MKLVIITKIDKLNQVKFGTLQNKNKLRVNVQK